MLDDSIQVAISAGLRPVMRVLPEQSTAYFARKRHRPIQLIGAWGLRAQRIVLGIGLLPLVFMFLFVGCSNLSRNWDGTWKLNPSRSQVPGVTFQIALSDSGEYTIDYGAFADRFRCDGREYHLASGKTISCNGNSGHAFDSIARRNGVVLNTPHWEVSTDDQKLTIKMTAHQSNNLIVTKAILYQRAAGTTGFPGAWMDADPLKDRPHVMVLAVRGNRLHYGFPEAAQYADLEMNGSDAPWNGPSAPVGATIAVAIRDRSEFIVLRKLNGHLLNQGTISLSADEQNSVEEFWSPDRPDVKSVLVWDKEK